MIPDTFRVPTAQTTSKVLIVEDEFLMAVSLKDYVIDMGLDVVDIATSGREAIRLARQHRPDLILMDVRLIGPMDGIEAGRLIGAELGTSVIIVSGSLNSALMARIDALPTCKGIIEKPFRIGVLMDRIRGALQADQA